MRAVGTYERHVRLKIEIVLSDELAPTVAETIRKHVHTGNAGDGHIFILPVNEAIGIRTDVRSTRP